jgi:hypothetical protein
MICSAAHLIVMTGLDPVIHGNVAACEDVDGRIKSGHDEERATWPNAIALRKGGRGSKRSVYGLHLRGDDGSENSPLLEPCADVISVSAQSHLRDPTSPR